MSPPGRPKGEYRSAQHGGCVVSIASPCINVCRMNEATGWCEGCARSLQEIAAWGSLDDAGKQRIWQWLPARQERLASLGVVAAAGSDK